jgi:hypothetical protein
MEDLIYAILAYFDLVEEDSTINMTPIIMPGG